MTDLNWLNDAYGLYYYHLLSKSKIPFSTTYVTLNSILESLYVAFIWSIIKNSMQWLIDRTEAIPNI